MKKIAGGVLVLTLAAALAACSGNTTQTNGPETNAAPAETIAPSEMTDAASTETAAESAGTEQSGKTAENAETYDIPKGDWVIGLSNSYYGNTWRKQMVDSFETVAKEAKEKGYIKDYLIQNGDGTVNAQIAQINSFILEGVDAICINAASPTALNSVIDKAAQAGIPVIAFDSIVTNEAAYTMDYDFVKYGVDCGTYLSDKIGGKGNVIVVRGISGSAPDEKMNEGYEQVLAKNPGLKVVATVVGEAAATVAQEEISKVIPSLPEVDAVFTQGGDAYGVVQAFEQAGRKVPAMICDNSAEFINWWITEKEKSGYDTIGVRSAPSCGSAAFWTSLNILNGVDVPKEMMLKLVEITGDDLEQYRGMEAGTIAAPAFSNEDVMNDIIIPAR